MGAYLVGTAVTITETFKNANGVPTNPTTVVFTVQNPLGVETTYTWTIDSEVTNPSAGVFVLDIPLADISVPGDYPYGVVGTGALEAAGEGEFTVLQSALAPQAVPFPQVGPCTPWIDCGDIRAICETTENDQVLEGVAAMASSIMFEVSGRQYTGRCERTVRPCGQRENPCWSGGWGGWSGWPWSWMWDGSFWGWYDGLGCHCRCDALSKVLLPGYPVSQITEVKIDGVVQSADTYRIDDHRYLTRMRDPAEPGTPLFWPACQILDLDDTEPGTFSVSYISGMDVPLAGKAAAAALACELLPGVDCKLPTGAVRIVRQGITIDKLQPLARMLLEGMTGIVAIDLFMAAYNPGLLRRRPVIWSPDGPRYARQVGA